MFLFSFSEKKNVFWGSFRQAAQKLKMPGGRRDPIYCHSLEKEGG
jgi:hypothetical protein